VWTGCAGSGDSLAAVALVHVLSFLEDFLAVSGRSPRSLDMPLTLTLTLLPLAHSSALLLLLLLSFSLSLSLSFFLSLLSIRLSSLPPSACHPPAACFTRPTCPQSISSDRIGHSPHSQALRSLSGTDSVHLAEPGETPSRAFPPIALRDSSTVTFFALLDACAPASAGPLYFFCLGFCTIVFPLAALPPP